MNKLIIIGNLTRKPELTQTADGVSVCNFTVAVGRRVKDSAHPEADYFHVAAWRKLGEICYQYLDKGRKICVIGTVSAHAFNGNDGTVRASLDVEADEVQFLSPKPSGDGEPAEEQTDRPSKATALTLLQRRRTGAANKPGGTA